MTGDDLPLKVSSVFVPGGLPTFTYLERRSLGLEQRLGDYLEERHRILSLSGPTKAGKTVLLRSQIRNGLWLSGGTIYTIDDVWNGICDQLDLITEFDTADTLEETAEHSNTVGGSAKPFGVGADYEHASTEGLRTTKEYRQHRERSAKDAAERELRTLAFTLIIDDFHYIDPPTQLAIVRALKSLVFDGLAVIVASVPHRAYDTVRVEKEMTGRVEQLQIPVWQPGELAGIANEGFAALNIADPTKIAQKLSIEAFGSPHLMQDFGLQICKSQGIRVRPEAEVELEPPVWVPFFRSRATAASKTAYDLLARGPRQRTDRKPRTRKDGFVTDIYGAVLTAIASTGPRTTITYEQLRAALRDVLSDEPPQRHEVTRVLDEMCRIARDQIEGEPVIDYDSEYSVLHISDPFFAYFLKWGFIEPFLKRSQTPLGP